MLQERASADRLLLLAIAFELLSYKRPRKIRRCRSTIIKVIPPLPGNHVPPSAQSPGAPGAKAAPGANNHALPDVHSPGAAGTTAVGTRTRTDNAAIPAGNHMLPGAQQRGGAPVGTAVETPLPQAAVTPPPPPHTRVAPPSPPSHAAVTPPPPTPHAAVLRRHQLRIQVRFRRRLRIGRQLHHRRLHAAVAPLPPPPRVAVPAPPRPPAAKPKCQPGQQC
jgi:hypothetical protein